MARQAFIITISITAIVLSSPTAGRAQEPFTVQLSDSAEAFIVPDTIKLRDFAFLGRFDEPGTFREAVTRSILRAIEKSGPDLNVEGVIFHTFRIRELDGAHRELRFPVGDYATVEVRKRGVEPEPDSLRRSNRPPVMQVLVVTTFVTMTPRRYHARSIPSQSKEARP